MPRTVEYIRKAPSPAPRRKGRRTPSQDLGALLFRNRIKFMPYAVALGILFVAHLIAVVPVPLAGTALGLLVAAGTTWAMLRTDLVPRLDRNVERWYLASLGTGTGLWLVGATWGQVVPGFWSIVVLLAGTTAAAAPWWYHRRIRAKLPVHLGPLTGTDRRAALRMARTLTNRWPSAMGTAQAAGTTISAIRFDAFSVTVDVNMHASMQLEEMHRRCGKLETALDLDRGSARVLARGRKSRAASVRFMLKTPLDAPPVVGPPAGERMARLGMNEMGLPVTVDLTKHMLVVGRTGSGKTGTVHVLIREAVHIPWLAVVGIDAKPGAVEFTPWERSMAALGRGAQQSQALLERVRDGMQARGQRMNERGWRNWVPTPEEPHILVVIDEVQVLVDAGMADLLNELASLMRAFGGSLLLATQYPTDKYLPVKVKEQMTYRIGLKTEGDVADRVIFGENASKEGWTPSKLPARDVGSFFIRGPGYDAPIQCRTDILDDHELSVSQRRAPAAVPVDGATWGTVTASAGMVELEAGEDPDTYEVEEMPRNTEARVLWAFGGTGIVMHRTALESATGLTQKTVDNYLKTLEAKGVVVKVGRAQYKRLS
jgi:hypothetical protein